MSYVSVGYTIYDSIVAGKNVDPDRRTFADFWAELQAKYEAAKKAQRAVEARAALERAQLGKVTAETEAAIAVAKVQKAAAEAEQKKYEQSSESILGFAPTTLLLLGAAGYFLFIKKKGRR